MPKPRVPRFSRSTVNEEWVYQVYAPDFTAACTVRLSMIYRAAPILAWVIGRSQWTLEDYCHRKRFPYLKWRPGYAIPEDQLRIYERIVGRRPAEQRADTHAGLDPADIRVAAPQAYKTIT